MPPAGGVKGCGNGVKEANGDTMTGDNVGGGSGTGKRVRFRARFDLRANALCCLATLLERELMVQVESLMVD
jgi:hypothetical protein